MIVTTLHAVLNWYTFPFLSQTHKQSLSFVNCFLSRRDFQTSFFFHNYVASAIRDFAHRAEIMTLRALEWKWSLDGMTLAVCWGNMQLTHMHHCFNALTITKSSFILKVQRMTQLLNGQRQVHSSHRTR